MVIQHERQGNFSNNDDARALVNAVDYKKTQGRGKGFMQGSGFKPGNRICTYCGRSGQAVETYYRKHGFPPHFRKNSNSMPNNATNDGSEPRDDPSVHGDVKPAPPIFTHEQYQKLLSLIQSSKIGQQSNVTANQVSSSAQVDLTPFEKFKSGPEITEDDWFG